MREIVLVGGGGHCKSVIEAVESAALPIRGILDLPSRAGTFCLGHPVIGGDDDMAEYAGDCEFIITLGFIRNPAHRNRLYGLVTAAGGSFATVIASTAHVSRHASIGPGTVVLHGANVNAGASIGPNCIINTLADIEHDVSIGFGCHISTGAIVNGDCVIGDGTFVGSGCVVCNGVRICHDCVIGAGSVVTEDITSPGTYVGVPAKRL